MKIISYQEAKCAMCRGRMAGKGNKHLDHIIAISKAVPTGQKTFNISAVDVIYRKTPRIQRTTRGKWVFCFNNGEYT